MSWLKKLLPSSVKANPEKKRGVPEGIWSKCTSCSAILYHAELVRNLHVCPKCDFHTRINARERLQILFDEEFLELAQEIGSRDPLKFRDSKKYKDRLSTAQKNTSEKEALIVGKGTINKRDAVVACFNFEFMGGSMGSAVGESFVIGVESAIRERMPFICISASGGARMQEGLISLMQMAKTSAALSKLAKAGLPYISVLTDPTMGGVSASLGTLGDIIIAEPNALIGFAGPRVIEQTVRQKLPEGFQRAEFLLEHGHIDQVVDRRNMKDRLAYFIEQMTYYHK